MRSASDAMGILACEAKFGRSTPLYWEERTQRRKAAKNEFAYFAALRLCVSSYPYKIEVGSFREPFFQRCSMLRTTSCLTAVAIVVGIAVAGEPQPRLPRDNLLVYRGPDGKPSPVTSVADWAKRRA